MNYADRLADKARQFKNIAPKMTSATTGALPAPAMPVPPPPALPAAPAPAVAAAPGFQESIAAQKAAQSQAAGEASIARRFQAFNKVEAAKAAAPTVARAAAGVAAPIAGRTALGSALRFAAGPAVGAGLLAADSVSRGAEEVADRAAVQGSWSRGAADFVGDKMGRIASLGILPGTGVLADAMRARKEGAGAFTAESRGQQLLGAVKPYEKVMAAQPSALDRFAGDQGRAIDRLAAPRPQAPPPVAAPATIAPAAPVLPADNLQVETRAARPGEREAALGQWNDGRKTRVAPDFAGQGMVYQPPKDSGQVTTYTVPGKGSATFQGERRGGGSFSGAATDAEAQARLQREGLNESGLRPGEVAALAAIDRRAALAPAPAPAPDPGPRPFARAGDGFGDDVLRRDRMEREVKGAKGQKRRDLAMMFQAEQQYQTPAHGGGDGGRSARDNRLAEMLKSDDRAADNARADKSLALQQAQLEATLASHQFDRERQAAQFLRESDAAQYGRAKDRVTEVNRTVEDFSKRNEGADVAGLVQLGRNMAGEIAKVDPDMAARIAAGTPTPLDLGYLQRLQGASQDPTRWYKPWTWFSSAPPPEEAVRRTFK